MDFHKMVRPIIYWVFLCCTCGLIAYFMGWLTDDIWFRRVIWFIAVILDCFLQYMWLLSLKTTVQPLKYLLWLCCLLYMFYAIPSAICFFNGELQSKAKIVEVSDFKKTKIEARLNQIEAELKTIATYKETESKSGYGSRSANIKNDKDSLTEEQEKLLNQLDTVTETSSENRNPLDGFGEWKDFFLKVIVGLTIFFLYFGQFLILWDMQREKVKDETGQETDETESNGKPFQNEMPICPVCKNPFPYKPGKTYCNDKCRLIAFRTKLNHNLGE